jgi:hypothetical protein
MSREALAHPAALGRRAAEVGPVMVDRWPHHSVASDPPSLRSRLSAAGSPTVLGCRTPGAAGRGGELREAAVASWAESVSSHEHVTALRAAYRQWALDRDQTPAAGFPIARW